MIKGLLHFHSDFSYDGHDSIEQIANWGKSEAIDFIILTEHDNDFDDEKFDRYVKECNRNSQDIIIVPGIEYSFGSKRHIHINVFGVREFLCTNNSLEDIPRFIKQVKDLGGIAILNHPKSIIKEIADLDLTMLFGVELWNTKSDFLYSPDPRTYKFIKESLNDKKVFLTSDIHKIPKNAYAFIFSSIECNDLNSINDVINILKEGNFNCVFNKNVIENNFHNIQLKKHLLFFAGLHQKTYRILRNFKRSLGLKVSPKIVKKLKLK